MIRERMAARSFWLLLTITVLYAILESQRPESQRFRSVGYAFLLILMIFIAAVIGTPDEVIFAILLLIFAGMIVVRWEELQLAQARFVAFVQEASRGG